MQKPKGRGNCITIVDPCSKKISCSFEVILYGELHYFWFFISDACLLHSQGLEDGLNSYCITIRHNVPCPTQKRIGYKQEINIVVTHWNITSNDRNWNYLRSQYGNIPKTRYPKYTNFH